MAVYCEELKSLCPELHKARSLNPVRIIRRVGCRSWHGLVMHHVTITYGGPPDFQLIFSARRSLAIPGTHGICTETCIQIYTNLLVTIYSQNVQMILSLPTQ